MRDVCPGSLLWPGPPAVQVAANNSAPPPAKIRPGLANAITVP
jgi:hypothetical protein